MSRNEPIAADEAPQSQEITELLQAWGDGNDQVEDRLLDLVYDALLGLAERYLRQERSDHTLEPRALVHEAYLRLLGQQSLSWQSRSHFFGVAATTMRRILLDHARAKITKKRGGRTIRIPLLDELVTVSGLELEAVHVKWALRKLAERDPRLAKVVDLHFFAGLTLDEAASVLRTSRRTVARDWALARAWLVRELKARDPS